MEHERYRAAVSKRMKVGTVQLMTSVFAGHTHQANDQGDRLIRQRMSITDHIQVAAARKR